MLIQSISDQTYTGGKRYKGVLQCPKMFVKEYFSELWGPCTDYIRFLLLLFFNEQLNIGVMRNEMIKKYLLKL